MAVDFGFGLADLPPFEPFVVVVVVVVASEPEPEPE